MMLVAPRRTGKATVWAAVCHELQDFGLVFAAHAREYASPRALRRSADAGTAAGRDEGDSLTVG